jgi:hypothetical protein
MFIDYVTLLLTNTSAGFFLLAWYLLRGLDEEHPQRWVAAFAMVGLVALLSGFLLVQRWLLPGPFNMAYGELSVYFGVLFLGASLSLAKGWDLLFVAVYAFFAGIGSLLIGIRILDLRDRIHPVRSERDLRGAHPAPEGPEVPPGAWGRRAPGHRHPLGPHGLQGVLVPFRTLLQMGARNHGSRSPAVIRPHRDFRRPAERVLPYRVGGCRVSSRLEQLHNAFAFAVRLKPRTDNGTSISVTGTIPMRARMPNPIPTMPAMASQAAQTASTAAIPGRRTTLGRRSGPCAKRQVS